MKRIWALTDDRIGNVNQVLGVAESLGVPFDRKEIRYTRWVALPNVLRQKTLIGIQSDCKEHLTQPWPDVVISAGRRSFPVARWIKKQSGGHSKIVQIMNPGKSGFTDADLVVLPSHDDYQGNMNNVLVVSGSPHRVNKQRLAKEKAHWKSRLSAYPSKRVSLIVGGATKDKPFTTDMACRLANDVMALNPASVLVTTSRRTPPDVVETLKRMLPQETFFYRYGDDGENPYFGLLSWADVIVVTGDSISMCSECCATSVPVYIFAPDEMMRSKHKRFHQELYRKGYAMPLGTKKTTSAGLTGFNTANDIASVIHKKWL